MHPTRSDRRRLWGYARGVVSCIVAGLVVTVLTAWVMAVVPVKFAGAAEPLDFDRWRYPTERPHNEETYRLSCWRSDQDVSRDVGLQRMRGTYTVGYAYGAPARSLCWWSGRESSFWGPARANADVGGLHIRYAENAEVVLPCRLLWTGVAINTLVYGGVVWCVWYGPSVARRVVRRGRGWCEGCGYDLRGLRGSACPECGAGVCVSG